MQGVGQDSSDQRLGAQRSAAATTRLADQVPSYASPTASSKAKSTQRPQPPNPKTSKIPQRQPPPTRKFKTSCLSTATSRRRSSRPGPFRFLDLPPDIRNMIYEYVCPRKTKKFTDLRFASARARRLPFDPHPLPTCRPFPRPFSVVLPPLLFVKSKQIRDEFGSFIFTQKDIIFSIWSIQEFGDLLRQIGYTNCKRLVDNPRVSFEFWGRKVVFQYDMHIKACFNVNWAVVGSFTDVDSLWKSGILEHSAPKTKKDRARSWHWLRLGAVVPSR